MSAPTIRWAGRRCFLVECVDIDQVMALHQRLSTHPVAGQREVLAAARTVGLFFDTDAEARHAAEDISQWNLSDAASHDGALITVEVVYDGADLCEVATQLSMSVDELINWHTGTTWLGAFGGFAPGFTYLVSTGDSYSIPRRRTPRTRVPAQSVAVAGEFSAVYPQASPGGWQLLGHTNAVMWDLDRSSPALVAPGDRVQYHAVRERLTTTQNSTDHRSGEQPHEKLSATATPQHGLEIITTGLQTLVQDLGRPGYADLGVSHSGVADRAAARQANRLVGNDSEAAVLEVLMGGLTIQAHGHHVLALTGTDTPAQIWAPETAPTGSRQAPVNAAFALFDGEHLHLPTPEAGLRTYLAVRGGLEATDQLGSRATDTLSGIGPESVREGAVLAVNKPQHPLAATGTAEPAVHPTLPRVDGPATVLRVLPGPRDDWFGPAGLEQLTGQPWRVSDDSNRIGVRFELPEDGAALQRVQDAELPSEPAVTGALQVPPSGLPVLFLADHPVTGGYPVIGVVAEDDLDLAAQLPPGATVRFQIDDETTDDNPGKDTHHDQH